MAQRFYALLCVGAAASLAGLYFSIRIPVSSSTALSAERERATAALTTLAAREAEAIEATAAADALRTERDAAAAALTAAAASSDAASAEFRTALDDAAARAGAAEATAEAMTAERDTARREAADARALVDAALARQVGRTTLIEIDVISLWNRGIHGIARLRGCSHSYPEQTSHRHLLTRIRCAALAHCLTRRSSGNRSESRRRLVNLSAAGTRGHRRGHLREEDVRTRRQDRQTRREDD